MDKTENDKIVKIGISIHKSTLKNINNFLYLARRHGVKVNRSTLIEILINSGLYFLDNRPTNESVEFIRRGSRIFKRNKVGRRKKRKVSKK